MREFNSKRLALSTALLLAAALCYASNLQQPFDASSFSAWSEPSAAVGQWKGDGDVVTFDPKSASPAVGSPVTSSDTKSLSIDGTVVCTNTSHSADRFSQTELLVRVGDKFDTLPDTASMSGVCIAVAGGTNYVSVAQTAIADHLDKKLDSGYQDDPSGEYVPLYAYCVPKTGASADWYPIGALPTNTWARVTMIADYEAGLCKICVDGRPVVSQYGYLTTNKTHQAGIDGSWYGLAASTESQSLVQELKFRGIALVDDVVISQDGEPDFGSALWEGFSAIGDTESNTAWWGTTNISYTLASKWGVVERTARAAMLDSSGLTVGQKLEAGLDPLDGSVLELVSVERSADGTKLTVGYNGASKDGWHKFRVFDGNDESRSFLLGRSQNRDGSYTWSPSEPAFESRDGVTYATFAIPEAMRDTRSFVVKVLAEANDTMEESL